MNLFLVGVKSNNTTTVTVNTTSTDPATAADDLLDQIGNEVSDGSHSGSKIDDLMVYKVNGNPNIFSYKGDLTIEGCQNNTFVLDGVRTLIVEGNLIIKCNIAYRSNDSTASWAFIVKGGNIKVYP